MTNKPTWEQKIAAYGFLGTNLRSHDETRQFILDLLAEQKKELIEKIKNHKFTLYSARKALIDGNFVLPEEETVDVFDYKELLDLLKQD